MKSIQITGLIERNGAAAKGDPMCVRVALVQDTQTNGAQFNAEDVFVDPANADLDALTFRNLQFASRFKILSDETYVLNVESAAGNGTANDSAATYKHFKIYRSMNMKINFSATTGVIGSVTDNSLHLLVVQSAAASGAGKLWYSARTRFVG